MANYNIGPRIGIEGEAQFRAQISRINSEYRSMASYTDAVSKAMERQGKTQALLESKANGLRQQIALQKQAYEQYSAALDKVKTLEGDHTNDITRYEGALLHVRTEIERLTQELGDTDEELERLINGIEDLDEAAEQAGDGMGDLGDESDESKGKVKAAVAVFAAAGTALIGFGRTAVEAAAEVKAANAQFSQTFGDLQGTATNALRAVSNETGIAVTRLQSGYTALYAFTKSVGGDSETALNIAQRALRAAADSAAYYDRSMEDATETLQSFLKGNYENDAALGIAATETTRNAKANELYAKSFNELTEAQKVDTLLAMVEAGNKASGALGQAAREADSWANVTGELSEAWRQLMATLGGPVMEGLIPVIQGITGALKGWTEQTSAQELTAGIDAFRAGLTEADEALADSSAKLSAQSGLAQQYVDRLRRLEEAGLDTAESQREYAQTVELLNTLMPELNLTINDVTGRLEQNTGSIEDNIRTLKEQAEQQAKMAYYKKIIDEYAEAYEARYAAEQRLIELEEEDRKLNWQLALANQEYAAALNAGSEAQAQEAAYLAQIKGELQANAAERETLTGTVQDMNAALEAGEAKLNSATEGYTALVGASKEVAASTDAQTDAVKNLEDAYKTATVEARKSLDSQIGLFEELAEKNEWSAEKIIKNWERQQKAFTNYGDNLKKAVELGLDESLIRQLSDGSQQSMQILDALVNDTKISVSEINEAFHGMSESRDYAATAMGEVSDVVHDALAELAKYAESAGANIVEGAVRGIKRNTPKFKQSMVDLSESGKNATAQAWDMHSPSRWMRDAADNIVDGHVDQIAERIRDMEAAMSDLGRAGQRAYQRAQLQEADVYPSMISGAEGYTPSTVTNNRTVSLGGIVVNAYTQLGQDSREFADAVLDVLTQKLGERVASI